MLRFKLHHLFAFSLLLTSLYQRPTQALGVNFDLKATPTATISAISPEEIFLKADAPASHPTNSIFEDSQPIPVPSAASQPPIRVTQSPKRLPNNVIASTRRLSPPPAEALPTSHILYPTQPEIAHKAIGVNFDPDKSTYASASTHSLASNSSQRDLPKWIYNGGSNSLVARVIGSAEGTRTPSGQPTRAYYGHSDPGNGVWNVGTFSYQHGANSPQEADRKQLKRLQRQGKTIFKQADQAELSMSLGEILNGLDLANQSPRAALARGGYIDRLAQAKKKGIPDNEAIIWARTYAYLDPDTQHWNAPGLGNTLSTIKRDQHRRHDAITQAFSSYQAQHDTKGESPTESLTAPIIAVTRLAPSQSIEQDLPASTENKELASSHAAPVTITTDLVKEQQAQPIANESATDVPVSTQADRLAFSMTDHPVAIQEKIEPAITPEDAAELSQATKPTANLEDNSQASASPTLEDVEIQS